MKGNDEISVLLKWSVRDLKEVNDMRKYLLKKFYLEDKHLKRFDNLVKFFNFFLLNLNFIKMSVSKYTFFFFIKRREGLYELFT